MSTKTVSRMVARKGDGLRRGRPGMIVAGSKPGAAVSPPKRKQLTAAEKRTDKGRFAVRLSQLLDERGWNHKEFASRVGRGEAAVRSWLRADVIPSDYETLLAIGKALDTMAHPFPDYRMILPEPR